MLPEVSGIDVLKTLRTRKETERTSVVALTARKDEEDRLRGFELGADDYIAKPFSPKELVLRVKAVLRRSIPAGRGLGRSRVLRAGPLVVEVEANRVTVDDREVDRLCPPSIQPSLLPPR